MMETSRPMSPGRQLRLAAAAALAVLAVFGSAGSAVGAAWPPGPRLAYVREGPPIFGQQVISAEPSGERWFKAATVFTLFGPDRLAFSPDGSTLAIGALLAPSVLITSADHIEPGILRGTDDGFSPVYSPDGETIAFSRLRIRIGEDGRNQFSGASIWLVPARGGRARQLTPWRNGLLLTPGSFSPDGSVLAAERQVGLEGDTEVILQPLDGGQPRRIAKNAFDPAFSPDGTKIAMAKYVPRPAALRDRGQEAATDLFLLDVRGHELRRLTRTPARKEEDPSWDPSGERLAFTQLPIREGSLFTGDLGSSIAEINADGTCRRKVAFTLGLSFRSPVWQPGPGRAVGRIEC
jgi:WD40-like Beta Propeller Repeat